MTICLLMKVDWMSYVTAVTSCGAYVSQFLKQTPAQSSLAALSILNVVSSEHRPQQACRSTAAWLLLFCY
jgi:hypothetical protein